MEDNSRVEIYTYKHTYNTEILMVKTHEWCIAFAEINVSVIG